MVQKVKSLIQLLIQNVLGYRNYLYVFSIYRVLRYQWFKDDADFKYFLELTHSNNPGTIIDAGANVGYTSVIFAKHHPTYHIISYEPVSLLSKIIEKVIAYFGLKNITVKQLALGNNLGEVAIKTPIVAGVKKQGLSFVDFAVDREDETMFNGYLTEQVKMVSIDEDLLQTTIPPVVGIKVDVENFEYFVLQGAQKIIKKYRPVVMAELWGNDRKIACIELMQHFDYQVKVIVDHQLVPYTQQNSLNYFFVPNSQ